MIRQGRPAIEPRTDEEAIGALRRTHLAEVGELLSDIYRLKRSEGLAVAEAYGATLEERRLAREMDGPPFEPDAPEFRHPDQRPGEILLGNYEARDYGNMGWKTKRRGGRAYMLDAGRMVAYDFLAPVFVRLDELEAAGIKPENVARQCYGGRVRVMYGAQDKIERESVIMRLILIAIRLHLAPRNAFGLKTVAHVALRFFHLLKGTRRFCEACSLPRAAAGYHTLVGHVCARCLAECKSIERGEHGGAANKTRGRTLLPVI